MYEKQTYSHKTRTLYKFFEIAFPKSQSDTQLRAYYAGKPTKRFIKSMEKERIAGIALRDYLNNDCFRKPF
jgi:hypothetical protein